MTPHHVLVRLARYFHVVWLDPAHHWREVGSVGARRHAVSKSVETLPSGFAVHVPAAWLPDVYRPTWLRDLLSRRRLRNGWTELERRGSRKFVLYLWHPQFERALALGGYDLSLYHIDDEYSFAPELPPMDDRERRVIRAVDHVLAISPGLMERKGGINPSTTFMPEGVDYALYATRVPEPDDLAPIPHPRIGYTGVLKRQLDWPLLHELASRHANWSFVLVGPSFVTAEAKAILDDMTALSNVHLLGPKSVTTLAAYPQHFDVCIMPYRVDGYTNNIYPLKLHEYLASGRPVVGSPIRSLREFDHVIALADSPDAWSAALASALTPALASGEAATARQAIAREHDWGEIIYRIARMICAGLGPAYDSQVYKLDVGNRAS